MHRRVGTCRTFLATFCGSLHTHLLNRYITLPFAMAIRMFQRRNLAALCYHRHSNRVLIQFNHAHTYAHIHTHTRARAPLEAHRLNWHSPSHRPSYSGYVM